MGLGTPFPQVREHEYLGTSENGLFRGANGRLLVRKRSPIRLVSFLTRTSQISSREQIPMKRIGAVSYLNTKPLVYGLRDMLSDYELVFDVPSRLSDRLRAGDLDVALIPVVEAVTRPEYTVVSDAAIACRGPVRSVKIVSRVEPWEIRSLALDVGSRTSVVLARVLLAKRHGVHPECRPLPLDDDYRDVIDDAVLLIGDRAMKPLADFEANGFRFEWDLGQTWHEWTARPFVFAVWAAGKNADLDALSDILGRCRDNGVAAAERIATEHAEEYGLSPGECVDYLSRQLHFYLGDEEKRGLETFFECARELSLIPVDRELNYHDCGLAGQSR